VEEEYTQEVRIQETAYRRRKGDLCALADSALKYVRVFEGWREERGHR
jgi:hypothetical protein